MTCPTKAKRTEFETWTAEVLKLLIENNLVTRDKENGIIPTHSEKGSMLLLGHPADCQKAQLAFKWHDANIDLYKRVIQ